MLAHTWPKLACDQRSHDLYLPSLTIKTRALDKLWPNTIGSRLAYYNIGKLVECWPNWPVIREVDVGPLLARCFVMMILIIYVDSIAKVMQLVQHRHDLYFPNCL